jgi:hypothetical protein
MEVISENEVATNTTPTDEIVTCEIDKLYPLLGTCPEPGAVPCTLSFEDGPAVEYHLCLDHALHYMKDASTYTADRGNRVIFNGKQIWPPKRHHWWTR